MSKENKGPAKMGTLSYYSVMNAEQLDFQQRRALTSVVHEAIQLAPKAYEVVVGRVEVRGPHAGVYEVTVRRVA
ncbi:hypothetical protein Mnod_2218 [Methylobacterium nodulans ORS 2060]|uniref:Uncharacterized protein n=1 Tax=Methylobacterium nodulans (strain LMG 21967 / CNCM I-2342 / ORS 2060) TaxID=460265 RepID=B8I9X0_METNO|nr:hypothetical protein Mnod_2218 [Methylobacterium nodulans ORS 2060]